MYIYIYMYVCLYVCICMYIYSMIGRVDIYVCLTEKVDVSPVRTHTVAVLCY